MSSDSGRKWTDCEKRTSTRTCTTKAATKIHRAGEKRATLRTLREDMGGMLNSTSKVPATEARLESSHGDYGNSMSASGLALRLLDSSAVRPRVIPRPTTNKLNIHSYIH